MDITLDVTCDIYVQFLLLFKENMLISFSKVSHKAINSSFPWMVLLSVVLIFYFMLLDILFSTMNVNFMWTNDWNQYNFLHIAHLQLYKSIDKKKLEGNIKYQMLTVPLPGGLRFSFLSFLQVTLCSLQILYSDQMFIL